MKRFAAVVWAVVSASVTLSAQFYNSGTEPGRTRWSEMTTENYRIVYPRGLDSLARVYAFSLEKWRPRVASTIGYLPNQFYRRPMPVVLHPLTVVSNGSVAWSPRTVDLLCTPDAESPMPMVWEDQLVCHESRHIAQMQFGASFRLLGALSGELWAGAAAGVYGGPAFLEGDAVTAETELSGSGRGRVASFLEYQRVCFSEGDWRDYWKWLYGSQKLYTPDHYRLGYMTEAGARVLSGNPYYARDFYADIRAAGGLRFRNLQKAVCGAVEAAPSCSPVAPSCSHPAAGRKAEESPADAERLSLPAPDGSPRTPRSAANCGRKAFNSAFRAIEDHFERVWEANDSLRAPFMESRQLTDAGRLYSSLRSVRAAGGCLYAIRSGFDRASELVAIVPEGSPDGARTVDIRTVCSISSSARSLCWSPLYKRLFWEEMRPGARWSLESFSDIHYLDTLGKRHSLTRKSRLFNPAVNAFGDLLSATEYPVRGGSAIVVLTADSGNEIARHCAPEGLQFVESAWLDGKLYATAISENGIGIYDVRTMQAVLEPQMATIKELRSTVLPASGTDVPADSGRLLFVSDRDGTDQLYSLRPQVGSDGNDCQSPGCWQMIQLTSTRFGGADFNFSEDGSKLYYTTLGREGRTLQYTESEALPAKVVDFADRWEDPTAECLSAQAGHLSAFESQSAAACGVRSEPSGAGKESLSAQAGDLSAFRPAAGHEQDEAGNMSAGKPYSKLAHLFRFHSWVPVFVNYDEIASLSAEAVTSAAGLGATAFFQNDLGSFYGYAAASAWTMAEGFTPGAHAAFTWNGWYPVVRASFDISGVSRRGDFQTYIPWNLSSNGWTKGIIPQLSVSMDDESSMLTGSLRGYITRAVPSSCIYPRWGLGVESGVMSNLLNNVSALYGQVYGYLPGIIRTHGIRFSAYAASSAYRSQTQCSLTYALPFGAVDWSFLSPLAYIRNFEAYLHGTYSSLSGAGVGYTAGQTGDGTQNNSPNAYGIRSNVSVGLQLNAVLGNLLWIPYDTRIGVSATYYPALGKAALGAVMSVDL